MFSSGIAANPATVVRRRRVVSRPRVFENDYESMTLEAIVFLGYEGRNDDTDRLIIGIVIIIYKSSTTLGERVDKKAA